MQCFFFHYKVGLYCFHHSFLDTLSERLNCFYHAIRCLQLTNNTRGYAVWNHWFSLYITEPRQRNFDMYVKNPLRILFKRKKCIESRQKASEHTGVQYREDFALLNQNVGKISWKKTLAGSGTDLLWNIYAILSVI